MTRFRSPLTVAPLTPADIPWVAHWLSDPHFADPLDLHPPVTPEHLQQGKVPWLSDSGQARLVRTRIYCVHDATRQPMGVFLTYDWDTPGDPIRELDLAMPALLHRQPRLVMEALTRFVHACIQHERPAELRTMLRGAMSRMGTPGLARLLNARRIETTYGQPWRERDRVGQRVLYAATPAEFYASTLARRLGLTRP